MDVIAFFQSANIFLSVSSDGGYCLTLLLLPDIKQFQQQGRNPGPASWRKPHNSRHAKLCPICGSRGKCCCPLMCIDRPGRLLLFVLCCHRGESKLPQRWVCKVPRVFLEALVLQF